MLYFNVYAKTSLLVNSDGSLDLNYDQASDNLTYYIVDEWDDRGLLINTRKYREAEFDQIKEDHPADKWENFNW